MCNAKEILAVAAAELGTTEQPPDSNRVKYNTAYYGREVSGPAYPWCCAFVWWLFQQAGAGALFYGGGKTASCTALYNWHRQRGQAVALDALRPGDLVFFRFDGQPGVVNHIGVCEAAEPGFVTTIDGNTGTESEANGGAVMRRRRAMKYVGGAIRPAYREEVQELTEQEIRAIVREELVAIEAERAAQEVPEWGRVQWEAAKKSGLMDGTRPMSQVSRLELAVVAGRMETQLDCGKDV